MDGISREGESRVERWGIFWRFEEGGRVVVAATPGDDTHCGE
jgi:hypothetical protein